MTGISIVQQQLVVEKAGMVLPCWGLEIPQRLTSFFQLIEMGLDQLRSLLRLCLLVKTVSSSIEL